MSIYYNPDKGDFLSPGRARVLMGARVKPEVLKGLGYYPFKDNRPRDIALSGEVAGRLLIKGPIVINGGEAHQTYTISDIGISLLESLYSIIGAPDAADDTAAAAAGVLEGGYYFANNTLKRRAIPT